MTNESFSQVVSSLLRTSATNTGLCTGASSVSGLFLQNARQMNLKATCQFWHQCFRNIEAMLRELRSIEKYFSHLLARLSHEPGTNSLFNRAIWLLPSYQCPNPSLLPIHPKQLRRLVKLLYLFLMAEPTENQHHRGRTPSHVAEPSTKSMMPKKTKIKKWLRTVLPALRSTPN